MQNPGGITQRYEKQFCPHLGNDNDTNQWVAIGPFTSMEKNRNRLWKISLDDLGSIVHPVTPILQNSFVRMEPLAKDHRERLRAAANEDSNIFRFMPTDLSGDGFDAWMNQSLCQSTELVWAVIDIMKNQVVGSTRYLNIELTHKRVEIGTTWYAPRFWGGVINPSCKFLMFRYGFETLGLNRIELKTDSRNVRSRAAIAKLGAREEGTLRRHMIVQDGYVRDTTYFSVIAEEWPEVKTALMKRLESFE